MVAKVCLTFILFLLFFCQDLHSQNRQRNRPLNFSGTVQDESTGEVLPGASIYLADDRIGVTVDHNGHYTVSGLPPGHHVIEISHTGYATLVEHIELVNDTMVNFKLSPIVVENPGVIITGVSAATSIRKAPIPVTSLRRKDLLQNTSTNIIDALTKVPGVSQLSTGPAISKPFIRGLGFNRVVVVNEGVRQEGQQWGDEHGIEIDEASVVKAEVLKGPASLMYGSDALAGVINLVTNTPVAQGTTKGNIISNFQLNGGLYSAHANLAGNRNGFNWNLYGSFKSAADYRNRYDGSVLNSRFKENNYGGYMGLNRGWGYAHLIFSRYKQEAGLTEGDRDPVNGNFLIYTGTPQEREVIPRDHRSRIAETPYLVTTHRKIVSDNNIVSGKSRLKLNLAYQENLRGEYGDQYNRTMPDLHFSLQTVNYNLHWQLPEMKEWHTTAGVNGMRQWNRNLREEALIPNYRLFDAGIFVFAQRFFSKSTLSGGFRFDRRDLESDEWMDGPDLKFVALSRRYSNFSGSLGVSRDMNEKTTLKLNIARGFRAPGIAELSSNGAHEGSGRYEYGNPNLHSETSVQTDAGAGFNFEHFNLDISIFYNRINDFIFYRKLSSVGGGDSLVDVDGEFITAYQFNQQDALLRGMEFTLDIHPHPIHWLHIENRFSFVRGTFEEPVDGSRNLPLIPAGRINSELRANLKTLGKSVREFYTRVELDWTLRQSHPFTGYDTETGTPGYALIHLAAGGEIIDRKGKEPLFILNLSLTNLTDLAYQSHLSRLKYTDMNVATGRRGVFNPGRNFSVRLQVPFNFSGR